MFFYFVEQIFVSSYPDFLELTVSMTSLTSTALQLRFVFLRSFLLLVQLRDLPNSKMTSELTYRTLNFMKIY